MTSGEPSAWAPPPRQPADPYAVTYDGPWGPTPGAPTGWRGPAAWSSDASAPVTDEQLRQLPPPAVGPLPYAGVPSEGQRPAVVGLAVTLAVTGSLVWLSGLSLSALVALATVKAMSPGDEGVVFHTLDQFVLRLGDGLWVPLYGFPVASVVTAFMLLARRPWTRLAHSGVGVASLAWAGWWLRDSLLPWFVVAVYVGTAVAVLWAPAVGRWYEARPARPRAPGYRLEG